MRLIFDANHIEPYISGLQRYVDGNPTPKHSKERTTPPVLRRVRKQKPKQKPFDMPIGERLWS